MKCGKFQGNRKRNAKHYGTQAMPSSNFGCKHGEFKIASLVSLQTKICF